MASGSSGRGSKGFDFGSDDILCSYDDYPNHNQDSSNGTLDEPSKDFHKSRMARTPIFPDTAYNSPEDSVSQETIVAVEKSMKKYVDNLMRFLEGISSRLSQLELYCYNLDKSIGEMRSDLNSDHGEADAKLKSLEKHIQEVHRSVQILRDKQELADTQKELAKLQLVQKESSSTSRPQSNDGRSSPSSTDPKRTDNASDTHNQHLALALPHQVAPQQQTVAPPPQAPAPTPNVAQVPQQPPYYMPPTPLPNPTLVAQLPQNQYMSSDPQYRTPQPTSSQVTQSLSMQQYSQYQQPQPQPPPLQHQWPQQLPQQVPPQQPPPMQSQLRSPSTNVYTPYPPSQPTNPSPAETLPNSMPMQMPYSGMPPTGPSRSDAMPYGYSGAGRTVSQPPLPPQIKAPFPAQPGDPYGTSGTHATLPPTSAYMVYDGEGGRSHPPLQPPHFAQGVYPPTSASLQNPAASQSLMVRNPGQSQFIRGHPYNELIEKLVNMGFRGDHVASVIQRMEDNGQPIDFNSVLDRLNVHSSMGPQRGWSG